MGSGTAGTAACIIFIGGTSGSANQLTATNLTTNQSSQERVILANGSEYGTIGSVIQQPGGTDTVTYGGTGTITIGGVTNTYTGATSINSATVRTIHTVTGNGDPTEFGNGGLTVTLASGGTLQTTGNYIYGTKVFSMGTGGGVFNIAAGTSVIPSGDGSWVGSGSTTVTGSGTFETQHTNAALTGGMVINGGTVDVDQWSTFMGTAYNITVNNGGTLGFAYTAALNWEPNVTLAGGTLAIAGGNHTISAAAGGIYALTLAAGTTSTISTSDFITPANARTLTISTPISGSGSLSISGSTSGSVVLTNTTNNTNTGLTTVTSTGVLNLSATAAINAIGGNVTVNSGGTLTNVNANQIPDASNVTVNGTWDLNSKSETVAAVSGTSTGKIQNTGGTAATLTAYIDGSASFSGNITGTALALTKTGPGTLTLSFANSYTGVTTVNAGTLSVSSLANGGSTSNIGNSTNAAANLVLGGGNLQYTGANVTTDRAFTLTAGTSSSIEVTTGATILTISGVSATTTGALTKIGSGTLKLSGANGYTGLTTVNAGTLQEGVANALSSGAVTVNDGGTYDLNNNSDAIGALTVNSGSTGGSVTTGTGTLTLGGNVTSTGGATNASISGNLDLGAATRNFTLTNAADGLAVSAVIRVTGHPVLPKPVWARSPFPAPTLTVAARRSTPARCWSTTLVDRALAQALWRSMPAAPWAGQAPSAVPSPSRALQARAAAPSTCAMVVPVT